MSSGAIGSNSGRLEITGPSDLIEELKSSLEGDASRDFDISTSKEPGIGGTHVLKLVLDITEVSVQLVSIYLAGRHIARESVRIKKAGKAVDVSKTTEQEAIKEKIKS